jgi:hypothetical protein
MRVEIIQGGQVLRQYTHEGQNFIEAPPEGDYQIRLTNSCGQRRLVVISVDGINVVDGTDAAHDGPGYVLRGWETATIKGWRRTDSEVASFRFNASQGGGYAEQTGRGTKNTGVIGIAVFNEKVDPLYRILRGSSVVHHHHYGDPICNSRGGVTYSSNSLNSLERERGCSTMDTLDFENCSEDGLMPRSATLSTETSSGPSRDASGKFLSKGATKSRKSPVKTKGTLVGAAVASDPAPDVNTGYGAKATMHTSTTEFERASTTPALLLTFRYAVRAKLIEWGVPVSTIPEAPEAFPASATPSVPAPPGWNG